MTEIAPVWYGPHRYSASHADAVFHDLRRRRVRHAVLRRCVRADSGRVSESIDLLIEPADLTELERCAQAIGLRRERSKNVSYGAEHPQGDMVHVLRVSVHTEMTYGHRVRWLRPGKGERSILRRAKLVDDCVRIAAGDELVDLVLRCVLDERKVDTVSRRRLRRLVEELRRDPVSAGHAAERVQRELAPALTWDGLLADIVNERWGDLLDRRAPLQRRLLERARLASYARLVSHAYGNLTGRGADAAGATVIAAPPVRQQGGGATTSPEPVAPEQISRRQIRGSGLLLAGRGLSTAMKFVAELLVVRYLATEAYGSWTYALSAVVFLRGLATLGLNRAVVRFLPVHLERGERGEFFGIVVFVLGSLLLATGTAVSAFYLFPETVARLAGAGPDQSLDILFIVILLLPIDTLDDFLTGIFAAFSASWTMFVRRSLLAPGLRVVVALLLVLLHADVRLLAYGYLAAGVIGLGYYGWALVGELRRRGLLHAASFAELTLPARRVLSYTVPVMVADVCAILLTTIGPLMLGYFSGMSAVALFQVVVPLVTLIQLVPQSFLVLYEPSAARLHARGDLAGLDRLYWRSAVWVAVLSFPAFAASFTTAEPLSVLLFGERYRAAGPILSLLAFGAFIDTILGFNVPTLRAADKMRWLVSVNVLAAAASVVLHLLFVPSMGALGAGIATGISWTLYAGLKQGALWKATGVRPLDIQHAGPYLTMALVTVVLATVRILRPSDWVVLVPTAVLASLLVLARARLSLSITDTFPEFGRFPLLKKVLG